MPGITAETKHIGGVGADGEVAVDETISLIASDKVEGTAVYDRAGNHLGAVHTAMINKTSGQVAYVVISFGGFLGIGAEYNALPWKSLVYDPVIGGYIIDVTREQLQGAPRYAGDAEPWIDPLYGRAIDDYYGVPYDR